MKRFLFSDNGTLKDYSTELINYHDDTAVIDYVATEDAIYIGSELPFNSLFFDVSVPNSNSVAPTVSHWDGSSWDEMVEILDETEGLTKSGHITWVPSKYERWQMEDTTGSNDSENITGLGDVTIYDLYWLKLTFSGDLSGTTALNWIGPKFCTDDDLTGEYTLFSYSNFKTGYESGKTSWEREIVLSSRLMVADLIKRKAILSGDQLLKREVLVDACVSKTAWVIFKNLGNDYKEDTERAKSEYFERLNKNNYGADKNNDGRLEPKENLGAKTGVLYK